MSRLDWKRGRFETDWETQEIHRGLRGFQSSQVYDDIEYFRFDMEASQSHNIYGEAFDKGKVYRPSVTVPCLHVTHDEGENQNADTGFYVNDNIYITASFDQFFRTGLTFADIEHEKYLKDRFSYDGKLFRVENIHILGQVRGGRDIILSIEGTQVKPDELANDPQFFEFQKNANERNPFGFGNAGFGSGGFGN